MLFRSSGRLAAATSEGVTRRLRNYLFDHIQHLSFTYHANMQTGELIQRCTSDVDAIRRFFADQAIGMGRIILLFIVNFTALMLLNVKLALYSIVIIPLIVVLSAIVFKKISKVYESYQEQDAVLSTILQENLSGVRVVKAFARQEYEKDKFERDNMEKYMRGKKLMLLHSLFWPISDTICGAQMMLGYVMGAIMAIGVATANSILMVTFANGQRELGQDALTAALEAGRTRMRPVLMTALAMIIGMLPMSLGLGEGGEQNAPLGRAVIGGLIVATAATLLLVPVVYSILRRKPRVRREEV